LDVLDAVPIVFGVDFSDSGEEDGENMCEAEVEEHDLDQGPVLFVVVVLYEVGLKFLYFLETLGQLHHQKQTQILQEVDVTADVDE
jgi:hypothetical protein